MQPNLTGLQQERSPEATGHENEQLNPLPVRSQATRVQIPAEPPTKLARPDLSFLNDDQHYRQSLSVAVLGEQPSSRHNNPQDYRTEEDVSQGLGEAYAAREQSQRKIRELWTTQGSNVNEGDNAAAETRRTQFLLDLGEAQKEFDYWDDRMRQISLAKRFFAPVTSTGNHTSKPFDRMSPRAFDHAPSQPESRPWPQPQVKPESVPVQVQYVEVSPGRGNMKNEKEPDINKPSPTVDVHVDPKIRRDVTLHLDMDLTEDVEEELEEFSRLRRIGHFKAAKRYFEEHLERCIDNAYVLDQYGQFLLEISDIHTLTKLAREFPAGDGERTVSANWVLVYERALQLDDDVCPQGNWRKTPNIRKLLKKWPMLDSTELQCLLNDLRVVRDADANHDFTNEEYGELYAHLQHEDRVWDFRDLFYGLVATTSLEDTIRCIFNKYLSPQNENASGVIRIIQQHWDGSADDEVTSLALLDIFTALAMWTLEAANTKYESSMDEFEELQTARIYLDIAHHYATEVLRQNPLNLKSRPYLQWVVAKVLVEKNTDPARCGQTALTKYLTNLRGGTNASTGTFRGLLSFRDMVVYTPNQDEAPDWQPDSSITFSHEQEKAIQMVARNARELGDVLLEAACLQQLTYSSPNTEVYLVDLCNLWRSVGNRLGLLRAYLYRYILKRTTDASSDLRNDLLEFGDTQCRVSLQKARFMILRALSTRSYEKAAYLKRAHDLDDVLDRNLYDGETSRPHRNNDTMNSSNNNGQQAINPTSDVSSAEIGPSDSPWSMGSQRPELHKVGGPILNQEETSLKNVLKWLNEQPPRKRVPATAFNEAGQTELMAPQPMTNMLAGRRHSTEIRNDFEHGEKNTLGSGSPKTTEGSEDMEDIIDLVDDGYKQRGGEEKKDDPDVGEDYEPEGCQDDVQSTDSQSVRRVRLPIRSDANSTYGPRPPSRPPFF